MVIEWTDFQTMWERRLLDIGSGFVDEDLSLVPASRQPEMEDRPCLVVAVIPKREYPVRSGIWECTIAIEYEYDLTDTAENVSKTWGQIMEAYGYGINGESPLKDRIAEGDLVIAGGIDSISYPNGFGETTGDNTKIFNFTAHLGIAPAA